MTRHVSNDELAARAAIKANAAPADSRDARAWRQVSAGLSVTGTQDSARPFLYSLTIPTLRDDALRRLNLQEKEDALRAELDAWEMKIAKDYKDAGLPVPAHLRAAERRLDAPEVKKLESAAAQFGTIADDVNEQELKASLRVKGKGS